VLAVTHIGGHIWAENFVFGCSRVSYTHLGCFGAPGEQEQVLNRLTMHPRSPAFPIRQAVPVGLLGLGFAAGLTGHGFLLISCTNQ